MKRKLAVIMAADVAGYSRLVAEDEEETLRRFESYSGVFAEFIERSGGRIFNTAGDAILAEFQSAVEAVRCAVDVQESLRARNHSYPPSRQMRFRIGITIGDVVERGGDLVGDGVNIAARLESLAAPGGICVSRSVHEAVAAKMLLRFADAGLKELKNIPDPVHAYMVAFETEDGANETASASASGKKADKWPPVAVSPVAAAAGLATVLALGGGLVYALRGDVATVSPAPTAATPAPSAREPATAPSGGETHAAAPNPGEAAPSPEPGAAPTEPPSGGGQAAVSKKPVDMLTAKYLLTRQWSECQEGQGVDVIVDACSALLDHGGLDGDDAASINYHLGRALRDKGEPDRAIAAYTESIRAKARADAHLHRGVAYYDKGDLTAALADLDKALSLDPSSAEAANNRAWIRYKGGDSSGALGDANLAIRLDSSKGYIWDTRAQIHEAAGNRSAAISDFRKALSLDPSLESSRDGLARLGASP